MLTKRIIIVFLSLAFILTACVQSSAGTEAPGFSQDIVETEEVEESEPLEGAEEPAAEEIDSQDSENQAASTEAQDEQQFDLTSLSGCRSKEPPAMAYEVLSPPTEDDWSTGSENAYVNIIEYADFQ